MDAIPREIINRYGRYLGRDYRSLDDQAALKQLAMRLGQFNQRLLGYELGLLAAAEEMLAEARGAEDSVEAAFEAQATKLLLRVGVDPREWKRLR